MLLALTPIKCYRIQRNYIENYLSSWWKMKIRHITIQVSYRYKVGKMFLNLMVDGMSSHSHLETLQISTRVMNSMFVPGMDIRFLKKTTFLTLYCGNVVTRLYSSVPNLYCYIYYQTILLVYPVSLFALSYIRELYL